MNELMKILLSLSVSGALLLILILGLKPLYKNRFSKRWQYYIWIVVALRFLLPLTPDTTIVGSLFEKFDTAAVMNEIPTSPNVPISVNPGNSKAEPIQTNRDITATVGREPFNIYVCLFFIWSALALVLFVRKITVYQGFIQYIKAGNTDVSDTKILNLLSDCEEKLNIKTRVELSCNSLIASPMLIGFFRPRIVLPAHELEDKELSYIFMHELIHYKQKDMFYKWLIQIVVCVHWFNPFVYLLEKEVNKSCELSCDETIISILDDKAKHEYGDTLISFLKSNNLYKSSLASVTLTEGAEQLKERLGAIMKFRKKSKVIIAITAIFTVAVCVCFFVIGAYAAPSVANDRKTWKDSKILNEILTEDGVYYIFCDGAGEDDKPLASVSAGNIMFVLVRKDSYTTVGPFNNMETLMEDVAGQCEYMNTLTQEEKELVIETAANIYGNVELDNKNSIFEMELDRYYDDTDPFVNERLFCVSEDISTLKAKISFQMDGKSGIVEIRDNETDELIWANTWNKNIENDTFTISLNNILQENEYVIRFVGTEINYAKIEVVFESDLVQERERPRKPHTALENGHVNLDTKDSIKWRLITALLQFRLDE